MRLSSKSSGRARFSANRTATGGTVTREIPLDQFPTPEELWNRYRAAKGYTAAQEWVMVQDYYDDGAGKVPRYYQIIAINRSVEAHCASPLHQTYDDYHVCQFPQYGKSLCYSGGLFF